MKTNKLAKQEFESILLSIIKLESKKTISSLIKKFHIPVSIVAEDNDSPIPDYLDSINKDSKKTKYKGYDVRVTYELWDKEHQNIRVVLRTKSIINDFIFKPDKLVKEIKEICSKEIYRSVIPNSKLWGGAIGYFSDSMDMYPDSEIDFMQGTFYEEWKMHDKLTLTNKIAPLYIDKTTFLDEDNDRNTIIIFFFAPECFERKLDKTILKKDWSEKLSFPKPYRFKDLEEEFYYNEKSAQQGSPEDQFNVGYMYYKGEGTLKDLEKAFNWYQKSAEQGFPQAQYNLGLFYEKGHGTSKDLNKAFSLYEESAEQGHAEAQHNLALMYEHGEGTLADKKQAAYWMNKAKKNGYQKAKETTSSKSGNGVNSQENDTEEGKQQEKKTKEEIRKQRFKELDNIIGDRIDKIASLLGAKKSLTGEQRDKYVPVVVDLVKALADRTMLRRSEERRVGKECRSRWSPYH